MARRKCGIELTCPYQDVLPPPDPKLFEALRASIAQSKRTSNAGADAGTSRRYGLGAVHYLSKRTALYATVAHVANRNGSALALNGATTAPNRGSNGMDLGIRHLF